MTRYRSKLTGNAMRTEPSLMFKLLFVVLLSLGIMGCCESDKDERIIFFKYNQHGEWVEFDLVPPRFR